MSSNITTCHQERARGDPPLYQNGHIVLQVYHIGWIISGFFAIFATAVSFWLIDRHLQWYTSKREQRYIVRILFMVPIYALVSFASFLFWNHSTVLILIRDAYESTVLTSFFYLLLMCISHDPEKQKSVFLEVGLSREADQEARKRGQAIKKWIFPLRSIQWKPQDGLYFLQLTKWGILQYCVIRPTTTLVAIILDYLGLYCEQSWGLGWGHIYISIIVSISVTIAMYCLIQLYVPISAKLSSSCHPLLRLFAIKAVVFLTFWQATLLSLLSMFGVVKDIEYMTAADVNIGIGAVLETFEMMFFAFLHIRAFSYKPYQSLHSPNSTEHEKTPRLRSLGHAMDFRETFREIWIGCIYLWDKIRGREPEYDIEARRTAHYRGVFGRARASQLMESWRDSDEATLPKVKTEACVDMDIGEETRWLGLEENYGHDLHSARRERSDSLGIQIERELKKRGLTIGDSHQEDIDTPPDISSSKNRRPQPSWWRRIYNRLSDYESEDEQEHSVTAHNSRRRSKHHSRSAKHFDGFPPNIDDPPPLPNLMPHQRHRHPQRWAFNDTLAPLPVFIDGATPHPQKLFQSVWPSNSINLVVDNPDNRATELVSPDFSSRKSIEGEVRGQTIRQTHQPVALPSDPRDRDVVVDLSPDLHSKESRSHHRRENALHSETMDTIHHLPHLPTHSPTPFYQGQVGLSYTQIRGPDDLFPVRSDSVDVQHTHVRHGVSDSWLDSEE